MTNKGCVKQRYPPLESENSSYATLRGYLSNSRALINKGPRPQSFVLLKVSPS